MAKEVAKNEAIVIGKTVTQPISYRFTLEGIGGLLFCPMPPPPEKAGSKKAQQKVDLQELEFSQWRERIYFDSSIGVFIPGENIHECLKEGAKYWGKRIPGEGQKTYTDLISSAVIVENMPLGNGGPMLSGDPSLIPFGKWCNATPSKGKKSGAKVYKIRAMLPEWYGAAILHVLDSRITRDVLETVFTYSGTFRGLCDWRPKFGRFRLVSIEVANET